jgi:hypothetical protein
MVEPFISDPIPFGVEIAIPKLEKYCVMSDEGQNCEASREPLPGNGSANTPVARQQLCNVQQWSNWEAVLSTRSFPIAT